MKLIHSLIDTFILLENDPSVSQISLWIDHFLTHKWITDTVGSAWEYIAKTVKLLYALRDRNDQQMAICLPKSGTWMKIGRWHTVVTNTMQFTV